MIELNGKLFGSMHQTFGGDTLNTAVYLSRSSKINQDGQSVQVQYVTAIGTDPISNGMIASWLNEGINTDLVLRDKNRIPGLYLIQLDDQGERTFLYWRNQSAARHLLQHPDFDKVERELSMMDMVFVSGISLAILPESDRNKLVTLLTHLRSQGVDISFDSNYRPALWPNDQLQTVKTNYRAMYKITDLALVTFDDEQLIWGDANPNETLVRLHKLGVNKVVIKLGKEGCIVSDATTHHHDKIPTTPVETVVDTTSAGDAFNGGFLSCYLAGGTLAQSCQRGNTLAGIVIQHRGAIIPQSAIDIVTQPQN